MNIPNIREFFGMAGAKEQPSYRYFLIDTEEATLLPVRITLKDGNYANAETRLSDGKFKKVTALWEDAHNKRGANSIIEINYDRFLQESMKSRTNDTARQDRSATVVPLFESPARKCN